LPNPECATDIETSAGFSVDEAGAFHFYSDLR
jgi:hypothetical protein